MLKFVYLPLVQRKSQYEYDLILSLLRMPLGPDDAILTRSDSAKKNNSSGSIQVVRSGVQRSVADCLRRIGRSFEEEVPFESLVSRQCDFGGGDSETVKWKYTGIWPIDFVLSSPRGRRRGIEEEHVRDDESVFQKKEKATCPKSDNKILYVQLDSVL